MSDAEMIAITGGLFLLLGAIITGMFALLTARISRNGKRYEALQIVVGEQAEEIVRMKAHGRLQDRALKALEDTNEQQKEEMAALREQVAVFQVYVDTVDDVFSSSPDEATVGSIRPKIPTKPVVRSKRVLRAKPHD